MSRSVATFDVPGVPPPGVFAIAIHAAAALSARVDYADPFQVVVGVGDKALWARRVVRVWAVPTAAGSTVTVEAWIETILVREWDVSPHKFVGLIPRRQGWKLAAAVAEALGARPAGAYFRHG
ncbi:MAG TPA: hypothetical protein VGB42_06185 [Candidatus Thermoplasmatota archaeon]